MIYISLFSVLIVLMATQTLAFVLLAVSFIIGVILIGFDKMSMKAMIIFGFNFFACKYSLHLCISWSLEVGKFMVSLPLITAQGSH